MFVAMDETAMSSQLFTFYELFGDKDHIDVDSLNHIESLFLVSALDELENRMEQEQTQIVFLAHPPQLRLLCIYSGEILSKETIVNHRTSLLKRLNQRGAHNYPEIANRCLEHGKLLFVKLLAHKENEINKIHCCPVVSTGEDWSVRYETGFGAGGSEIAFPDANTFSDLHFKVVIDHGYATLDRIYLDYWYWCHIAILHESVHCLQAACGLTDETGWALEHDASRLQAILPALIVSSLKYPGLFSVLLKLGPNSEYSQFLISNSLASSTRHQSIRKVRFRYR